MRLVAGGDTLRRLTLGCGFRSLSKQGEWHVEEAQQMPDHAVKSAGFALRGEPVGVVVPMTVEPDLLKQIADHNHQQDDAEHDALK